MILHTMRLFEKTYGLGLPLNTKHKMFWTFLGIIIYNHKDTNALVQLQENQMRSKCILYLIN